MNESRRWVVVLLIALLVIAFVAVARGREHRRGDDVGAFGSSDAPAVIVSS